MATFMIDTLIHLVENPTLSNGIYPSDLLSELLSNERNTKDVATGSHSTLMVKHFKPFPVVLHKDLSNHSIRKSLQEQVTDPKFFITERGVIILEKNPGKE